MQLWEANALQRLSGIYFLKENIDCFKAIGTVNLQRLHQAGLPRSLVALLTRC